MGAVAWGLWPTPRFPFSLIGRVEDWRAGLGRSLCSRLSRPFVCECHNISTVPRFQSPPRRTQHADFPHCALLFASPQGLWDLSCRGDFRQRSANPVIIEQSQGFVQPLPTPSRPTEALSFPSTQHVAPTDRFLFDRGTCWAWPRCNALCKWGTRSPAPSHRLGCIRSLRLDPTVRDTIPHFMLMIDKVLERAD
jgi:hypothetical protein